MAARRSFALSALAALGLACAQGAESKNPLQRMIEVTPSQERSMGAQLDAWVQENMLLVDDPIVLALMNDLGQSLVRNVEPQPFVYRFRVVVDPSLNAFAGPAGYIYFNTGLILAAGSVDELAGVMAHEIAHAKRSHVARSIERATVPDLLAKLVGMGVAVAAEAPEAMIAAQGVSASLQLAYSRELEAEADEVGSAFLVRAGFDPMGMAVFFERLGAQKEPDLGFEIPPYLRSHPQAGARMDAAVERARNTTIAGQADPQLRASFPRLQVRLARVLESGRTTLPADRPTPDRALSDSALLRAEEQVAAGQLEAAITTLEEAEAREPNDARLPFRRGELLNRRGDGAAAIDAWRGALALDPQVALTYYQIGRAYQALGDRVNAVFYLEQAARRFERGGTGRERAERLVRVLTHPVLAEAGTTDGASGSGSETPAGNSREIFPRDAEQVTWWARVEPEWNARRSDVRVRWTDPSGRVVQEEKAEPQRRSLLVSELELSSPAPGIWQVEAHLDTARIDRRTFRIEP
jgi:predicted Zn-dependent protease